MGKGGEACLRGRRVHLGVGWEGGKEGQEGGGGGQLPGLGVGVGEGRFPRVRAGGAEAGRGVGRRMQRISMR